MATSSFFRPFVVKPEDEAAWVRAFDLRTKKFKRPKDLKHIMLDKEEGLKLLEKMVRNSK